MCESLMIKKLLSKLYVLGSSINDVALIREKDLRFIAYTLQKVYRKICEINAWNIIYGKPQYNDHHINILVGNAHFPHFSFVSFFHFF